MINAHIELTSLVALKAKSIKETHTGKHITHTYTYSQSRYASLNSLYLNVSHQVSPAELSSATPQRSFSRPARPANQRPPSRWACRAPTATITVPSGPMYHSPSPLARPPSPLARTPSPALKRQQSHFSYSLHTETVIM